MISFPLKPFVCAVGVYFAGLSFVPFVFILQVLHSGVLLHCANNMISILVQFRVARFCKTGLPDFVKQS
jgi:hypothetical protein